MTMVGGTQYVVPHRKPVPAISSAPAKPVVKIVPDGQLPPSSIPPATKTVTATIPAAGLADRSAPKVPPEASATPVAAATPTTKVANSSLHSRTRTSSSSVFPNMPPSKHQASPTQYSTITYPYGQNRRTLSNATSSTTTTGGPLGPVRTGSSASASLRRSGSSRSAMNNIGYVASMRKQRATVWCDRSQGEDPRMVAKKALKERLNWDGASRQLHSTATSSFSTRGKIVNTRKVTTTGYTPADFVGGVGGVPMRLSASEVGDDDENSEDDDSGHAIGHIRTGSGRSSIGSGRRHTGSGLRPMNQPGTHRLSQGSTPPGGNGTSSNEGSGTMNTPVPFEKTDYFNHPAGSGMSGGSTSSGDRENSFGNVGKLSPRTQALVREKSTKNPDELRRRGSIDERTSTMTGVRLYIANPDLSD